ncbi:MAG: YqgE/AlgH family protein [Lacunisphaera sp.]
MKERRSPRKAPSLAGQLLLAHPILRDANFQRTVVLLSSHNAEGAMGVVLNRRWTASSAN